MNHRFVQRLGRWRWGEISLLLAALLLYLATLDNGFQTGELAGGDLITHQYAQVQARPSNAPGYPLYTMGGWLWFHALRPLANLVADALGQTQPANPIPILSSYSTLWALLSLWLLYRILNLRLQARSLPGFVPHPLFNLQSSFIAWLLCAFYATTYFFWYYATTTEQYSSAVAHTLGIVYVYLLWREAEQGSKGAGERGSRGAKKSRRDPQSTHHAPRTTHHHQLPATGLLLLLAFLCGLALAHMPTVALIVPPVMGMVLWQAPHLLRRPRLVAGAVIAAALPLASYLYVWLRGAAHPEWWGSGSWPTASAWFWSFVSTAQGREELLWGFEPGRAFWGGGFPELMWQELSIVLVLGVVGIAFLDRKLATLLYTTLAFYLAFCWAYRYGNWFQVILPLYPLILIGAAALINYWQFTVDHRQFSSILTRRILQLAPFFALALLLLWRTTASLPAADSRNRSGDSALDSARVLLTQPLPPSAPLFAALDDALALQYLSDIWRIRADVQPVSSTAAAQMLAAGQPVFTTWQAAPLLREEIEPKLGELSLVVQSETADWLRLQSAAAFAPATPPLSVDLAVPRTNVTLSGYTLSTTNAPVASATGEALDVTLFWQGNWPADLRISLRPTRSGAPVPAPSDPAAILQQDRPGPAYGQLDRATLSTDVPLADAYHLPLVEGVDGLAVILYRTTPGGFENVAEFALPLP